MYAVIGASGNTGSVAVRRLLDEGAEVRAVVRRQEAAQAWARKGASAALADLGDEDALVAAVAGAEGVYVVTPPGVERDDVLAGRRPQDRALRRAMERAGVLHVVLLSSIGADSASAPGPIRGLHHLEGLFADYPGAVTALRPPLYFESWAGSLAAAGAQGVLPSMMAPNVAIDMASTVDVGNTAATLLTEGGAGHRVVELHGARLYGAEDIAGAAARALGRPVRAVYPPREQWHVQLTAAGLSEKGAALMEEMFDAINGEGVHFTAAAGRRRANEPLDAAVSRLVVAAAA